MDNTVYYIMETETNKLLEACIGKINADKIVEDYQKQHRNVKLIIGG